MQCLFYILTHFSLENNTTKWGMLENCSKCNNSLINILQIFQILTTSYNMFMSRDYYMHITHNLCQSVFIFMKVITHCSRFISESIANRIQPNSRHQIIDSRVDLNCMIACAMILLFFTSLLPAVQARSLGCPMLLQDGDTMLPRTHADCLSVADRDPVICVNRSDMGGSIRHKHFRFTSPNLY